MPRLVLRDGFRLPADSCCELLQLRDQFLPLARRLTRAPESTGGSGPDA